MMWIALLVALVLALGALAYVVWPLLKPGPAPIMVEDDRLTELLGRKDAVLKAIKDLEFDYQVGKLSQEDYQVYDQRLRRQAIGLLQQIEQVAPMSASLDSTLELEIARRRRVQDGAPLSAAKPGPVTGPVTAPVTAPAAGPVPAAVPAPVVSPIAVGAAAGAAAANGGVARFCTNCGNKLEAHHKFCANCGAPAAA